MKASAVLDASAILAWILDEAGGELVDDLMDGGLVLTVNLSEVVAKAVDKGSTPEAAIMEIGKLPILAVAFDADLAFAAGALRAATHHLGLSLGDRACLALARREGLPAFTADRSWAKLDVGVEVVLIR